MITQSPQEARILELISPMADEMALEIVRLRVMGGKRPILQIMINRSGGGLASIDQCADFSRLISPLMDVHDPLPDAYHLEISTPGIDRPLTRFEDFARWIGHWVKLELKIPLEGRRRFRAIIEPPQGNILHFEVDETTALECQLHELSRADLILTDALIEASRAAGELPPQYHADNAKETDIEIETIETPDKNSGPSENLIEDVKTKSGVTL